jgi:hypothetical protein
MPFQGFNIEVFWLNKQNYEFPMVRLRLIKKKNRWPCISTTAEPTVSVLNKFLLPAGTVSSQGSLWLFFTTR